MIRVKRKSPKILKFSSRQPVVVAPSDTGLTGITVNFVIDPIAALKSGAENVSLSIVRKKFLRPTVIDDYQKNGDIASKIRNFSQTNEKANQEYNQSTVLQSSFSVQEIIQNNAPQLLDVDLDDTRALNRSFSKTEILVTEKTLAARDKKSAITIPASADFVFSGQEQLFNPNNSKSSLRPSSSKLSSISQNIDSLAAGVFIANCARFPFPLQQTQRIHRDLKVSQYGELIIEQDLAFLDSLNEQVVNETVVLNADQAKTRAPVQTINVNSYPPNSNTEVYNEFSGITSSSEKLFLIAKRLRKFEFGVTAGYVDPAGINNFIVIATVRNSNGVALQKIEKEIDATKVINSVSNPLSKPGLLATSGNTDSDGNFSISCIVSRRDFFNSGIIILAKEPGGRFEKISSLNLNLDEPLEFSIIPEAEKGFLRIRAITVSGNESTSQQFSEIAVNIGEAFEIFEQPVGSQQASGKSGSIDVRSLVRSLEDGLYEVTLSTLLRTAIGGRTLPPLFDQLTMRRVNLANGERPEDPTSGITVFETGTTFTGQFGGSVRNNDFIDRVEAGSYVYVFDGTNSESGFEEHAVTSIPVTIPEGFVSEPRGKKTGSDGTLIRSAASASLNSERLVGNITINTETEDIVVLQSGIGLVLEGSNDFSKQAEIKIEPYITGIEEKEDGTLEIAFSIPEDDIPEDVKDEGGRLVSSTSSASFQYENRSRARRRRRLIERQRRRRARADGSKENISETTEGISTAKIVSSFEEEK